MWCQFKALCLRGCGSKLFIVHVVCTDCHATCKYCIKWKLLSFLYINSIFNRISQKFGREIPKIIFLTLILSNGSHFFTPCHFTFIYSKGFLRIKDNLTGLVLINGAIVCPNKNTHFCTIGLQFLCMLSCIRKTKQHIMHFYTLHVLHQNSIKKITWYF